MRELSEKPRKMAYKAKMVGHTPYFHALNKLSRQELIKYLIEFKEDIVNEIKTGEKINHSARKLFTKLSIKAGIKSG